MATIPFPLSDETLAIMAEGPQQGGSHLWLAQVAGRLSHRHPGDPETLVAFLTECCEAFVRHRKIEPREIEGAVNLAYSDSGTSVNFGTAPVKWLTPNPDHIKLAIDNTTPLFDGVTSTGLTPQDVLRGLFNPGELVCSGAASDRGSVRPLEAVLADAHLLQFIVVNPMRGMEAVNKQGNPSMRCQANTGTRRHLVAEFDDPNLTKEDQARLVTRLGEAAPLVMAVDSGGKSVHAWYRVDEMPTRQQTKFFQAATSLGADPSRWDVCGWLRMPGGVRAGSTPKRQKILYWRDEH